MTSNTRPYSDLEVDRAYSDLEAVPQVSSTGPTKNAYYAPDGQHGPMPYAGGGTDTNKIAYESGPSDGEKRLANTICGMRKKPFWIVVAVAIIVVIAAAVGGGVGGALSSRKSSSSSTSSNGVAGASNSSSTTTSARQVSSPASTSTSATQVITTTTLVGPSNSPQPTLLRDCPSSNNSIYAVTYGSTSFQYRKLCDGAYLNIDGVTAPVQGVVKSLNDCINLCANYDNTNSTEIASGNSPICNSVCWRNTFDSANDWEGGHCFGFTTSNATVNGVSGFQIEESTICDSAVLINQNF